MQFTITRRSVAPQFTQGLVKKICRSITAVVTTPRPFQLSLVVVNDAEMKSLNKRYRSVPDVTDVLSFPYDGHNGEVVVCYTQVVRQARAKLLTVKQELAWVIVHGVLHTLGYDHERASDAQKMRALEQAILTSI